MRRPVSSALLLFLVTLGLALSGCSQDDGGRRTVLTPQEPLENVHTLVATFMFEDVPEDFILARPGGMAVDIDSDLLILDEDYLKVFDSEGNPMTRLGGPGEGPGEFQSVRSLWYSPNGYYAVFGGQFGTTAHYFRPDHSFIERVDFMVTRPFLEIIEARGIRPQSPEYIFSLGEDERVYSIDSRSIDRNRRDDMRVFLFHETPDSLHLIADYQQTRTVWGEQSGMGLPFMGRLQVVPLSGRRLVYIHTLLDTQVNEDRAFYTLTIYNLDSRQSTVIEHAFEPKEIDWVIPTISEENRNRDPGRARQREELYRLVAERCAEQKYISPVNQLIEDRDYLFVYLDRPRSEYAGEETPLFHVDVFDVDAMRYISSARLPRGSTIRGGFLYSPRRTQEEGYSIKKYQLDRSVYRGR